MAYSAQTVLPGAVGRGVTPQSSARAATRSRPRPDSAAESGAGGSGQWEGPALVPGLHVHLDNARPLTGWGEHNIPGNEPRRKSVRFRTCRNYQFAWWLRTERNAPDAPPEYVPPKWTGDGEQMSLM